MNWSTHIDGLSSLFDKGGGILWSILAASILLWFLILERYWAYRWQLPELRAGLLRTLQAPATKLVRLLGTPATQLAQVLKAHQDKIEEK